MTGVELAVGYLAAWAWRKARRVAGRADAEVDRAVDAGLDRLHDLITVKLADDPAIKRLEGEAATDLDTIEVRDITRQRVRLAIEDAAEADEQFAARLAELVAEVRQTEQRLGIALASGDRSVIVGGNAFVHAEGGGAAALTMGDVTIGAVLPHPPQPDRSSD